MLRLLVSGLAAVFAGMMGGWTMCGVIPVQASLSDCRRCAHHSAVRVRSSNPRRRATGPCSCSGLICNTQLGTPYNHRSSGANANTDRRGSHRCKDG